MIDNILIVGFEFPGAFSTINNFSLLSFFEIAIYMVVFLFTIIVVLKNKSISLRNEAELLHGINVYLIRSCF